MRPLQLSMTAFGPYAATEVVDFEALAELGLFTVAGRNGSGKTTIFDGLHFALYGSLPGRRASYPRLRSDHARPDVECRVELEFLAQGKRWRVERRPKQKRAKRKGSGDTERAQRATLYEIVEGEQIAVVNRVNEVNEHCRELVGLTGPQFERVALLPQGEFSRLLRESTSERRELLRALFSSDVFGDATTLLTDAAAEAGRDELVTAEHLERRLAMLAEQVGQLRGVPVTASPVDTAALRACLIEHHETEIVPRLETIEQARRRAADHLRAVQQAVDLSERLERRAAALEALAEHEVQVAQHESDRARLDAARAAVPVVDIATVARNQRLALDQIQLRVATLQNELVPLLTRVDAGLQVPSTNAELDLLVIELDHRAEQLKDRIYATSRVRELRAAVTELRDAGAHHERSLQTARTQRAGALQCRRDLDHERARLEARPGVDHEHGRLEEAERALAARTELSELERDIGELRHQQAELGATIASLDETIAEAERASGDLDRHEHAALTATEAVTELERRLEASRRFVAALDELRQSRSAGDQARRAAERAFDAFIRGASARIADTLVDGEPCPVCGADEHPAPAAMTTDAVDERDVATTRAEAERLATAVARLEHELETLREQDSDVAELDPTSLRDEIRSETEAAISAENAANHAAALISRLEQHRVRRQQLVDEHAAVNHRLIAADARAHRLLGALDADADESIDALQLRSDNAAERVAAARDSSARLQAIGRELLDLDDQIETIDLACLDLERQASASRAELDARSLDLVEAERRTSGRADADDADADAELEVVQRAARRTTELRSALAEHASAADANRRAELTLHEKLAPSPFVSIDDALDAHLEADVILALEASTTAFTARGDRLQGELRALGDLPDIAPDVLALRETAATAEAELRRLEHEHARSEAAVEQLDDALERLAADQSTLDERAAGTRRLQRVAGLVKGDNAHNTSLENWVLAAHLRDVVELANVRLARSTRHRFQLVVLAEGENRRARWGLDLAVEDTVTGTQRPTAGLSGGELFQASLALALGLADVVMNQRSGVAIDALFIDEGFGALDEASVERVLDLLDDVRSRGATVGVITHVNALLDVLPRGITVVPRTDGNGSSIQQVARAA